jgi:radical SAM superfamily enzyme YgiQ (UPF0313 family)
LVKNKPAYIGLNCFTTNVKLCHCIISKLENVESIFVIGGPHLLANKEEFLLYGNRVVSIVGYGEEAFLQTIRGYDQNLLESKELSKNVLDIVIDRSLFVNNSTEFEGFTESVCIASRGCYNHCHYCTSNKLNYYSRDISSLSTEIENLIKGNL